MAINPKIKQKAEDIRSKIFGSEVRESLASGIEAISEDVEATIGRQGYVEEQFQDVLDETTGKDVINGPEVIAARNGEANLKTRLDKEKQEVTAQLAQNGMLTNFYDINTDGTSDISLPIQELADLSEELYIQLPQGEFRWENKVHLKNKKIKIKGNNSVIYNFASGTVFNIGDENTQSTDFFQFEGITFVNLTPKKSENGLGTTLMQIRDINVEAILRDVRLIGAEQYGLNLRVSHGNIERVLLDNVHIYENAGSLGTTTSIALETHADGETGRIKHLEIMNCSFEVDNIFTDEYGNDVEVQLSNASKLQGVDNLKIINTDFIGGLENGPLSLIYDVKNVSLINVNTKSNGKTVSSGLVISLCPEINLTAINCNFIDENIVSTISTRESNGKIEFSKSKVGRFTNISGSYPSLKLEGCPILLNTQGWNIGFNEFQSIDCYLHPDSSFKNLIVTGSNMKFNNLKGIGTIEDRGNNNEYVNCEIERITPNGNSRNGLIKNTTMTTNQIPFHINSPNVYGWKVIYSTLVLTENIADRLFSLQGDNNEILFSELIQINDSESIPYIGGVVNGDGSTFLRTKNDVKVNYSSSTGMSVNSNATNFKQYEIGDIRKSNDALEVWNGLEFITLV